VDIREDEEQGIKLQETMELLLAAGYFRARIKGLHPFDKVSPIVLVSRNQSFNRRNSRIFRWSEEWCGA
jgi:CCDC93, coiled-coil domain